MDLGRTKRESNGHPVIVLAVCSDLLATHSNLFESSWQETTKERIQPFCHLLSLNINKVSSNVNNSNVRYDNSRFASFTSL